MSKQQITTKLIWNRGLNEMVERRSLNSGGKVQKYIDNTVLRLSDPYVPFLTGALKASGIRGAVLGSGEVNYLAEYADTNYYSNRGTGKQGTAHGGIRGRLWFERMKADHLDDIVQGAAKVAGGIGKVNEHNN